MPVWQSSSKSVAHDGGHGRGHGPQLPSSVRKSLIPTTPSPLTSQLLVWNSNAPMSTYGAPAGGLPVSWVHPSSTKRGLVSRSVVTAGGTEALLPGSTHGEPAVSR